MLKVGPLTGKFQENYEKRAEARRWRDVCGKVVILMKFPLIFEGKHVELTDMVKIGRASCRERV